MIARIVFICLIFFSMVVSTNSHSINWTSLKRNPDTGKVKSAMDDWKKDSLGCIGLRDFNKITLLIDSFQLKEKSYTDVIVILGKPNKEIVYKTDGIILRYLYHTCCRDGKLDPECDYSWTDFIFKDRRKSGCIISGGRG